MPMDTIDNRLTFDNKNHIYKYDGCPVISVTQVLKEAGLINSDFFTEAGRNRGVAVHHGVFLDVQGRLDRKSIHPTIQPYLDAWFKFKSDTGFGAFKHLCEKRMYHPLYKYAGTPDLIGMLNSRPIVLDIKTGDSQTAKYQTAAYSQFIEIIGMCPARGHLRLFDNGKYSLVLHKDHANDFASFLSALYKVRNFLT